MKHFLDDKRLKRNPYKVPEGYFDSLSKRSFDNVGLVTPVEIPHKTIHQSLITIWSSMAASVLIALFAGWYIIAQLRTSSMSDKYFLAIENSIQEYSLNTLTIFLDTETEDYDVSDSGLWMPEIDDNMLLEAEQEK
jgi:hypothetical protein